MYTSLKESFKQAPAEIEGKAKLVARNTFQYLTPDGWLITRLHLTDIIKEKGKDIILNTGGWFTVTTKDRINRFAPCYVYSKKGIWYVDHKGNTFPFYNGMNLAKTK